MLGSTTSGKGPYEQVDAILMPWARERALRVATEYKGYEIRSVPLYGDNGEVQGDIWVDTPDASGRIGVHSGIADAPAPTHRKVELAALAATLTELWLRFADRTGTAMMARGNDQRLATASIFLRWLVDALASQLGERDVEIVHDLIKNSEPVIGTEWMYSVIKERSIPLSDDQREKLNLLASMLHVDLSKVV